MPADVLTDVPPVLPGFRRVVFLSHVLGPGTPGYPGDPPVELATAATADRDGFYLQRLTCGEQSGTHWAAAAHFAPGEPAADQLEAACFFRPAVVIDARGPAAADRDYELGAAELRRFEDQHGRIPRRAAVLLRTGYDARWPDPAGYLGTGADGGLHYPGFGLAAARWLIEERGAGVLGTDTMGVDPGADAACRVNHLLLRGRRMHLENLCGLGQLPPAGSWLVIGGLRVQGGSGSPATVFGLIP